MADLKQMYGCSWPTGTRDLDIEMVCIRKGGFFEHKGVKCGMGLPHHYERMRQIIWPGLDDHRWHSLCRDTMLANKVTVLLGSGGTGKTHSAAWLYLCDYWCFPNETLVMVSSTDLRGLQLRVFGEIKKLFEAGIERFPDLPGNSIESKLAIATDNIEDEAVRDLRKGIVGIPCIQSGKFVGLGKYVGAHQKRVRLIADEAQFMSGNFLSAFANLNQNEDFWACVLGNPNDPTDSLGRAAEPVDGWTNHMAPGKTATWKTRFMDGVCVNLIGTDSPNFDFPQDKPPRYKYLPHRKQIDETKLTWGEDSAEYHQQCVGSMKTSAMLKRVVTRDMARQFRAQDEVIWKGTGTTKIAGMDSAYGGDRCVFCVVEFGEDLEGKTILSVGDPQVVPIKIATNKIPEDQISDWVKNACEVHNIPPENFFHDSTGRGGLGTSLARVWSAQTNPVEFGGSPSERPVSLDHFIRDPKSGERRLKLCKEHYMNFVSEMWYSIRFCIEASQLRNLPDSILDELCMRDYDYVLGKIQVEPKTVTPGKASRWKVGMKQRTGRSPDLGDALATCLEGARRRGFNISKLANVESEEVNRQWLYDLARKQVERRKSHQLDYRA